MLAFMNCGCTDHCRQLKFSKRYFWIGSEPVSTTNLDYYLRGEKPEIAHHNAAWSNMTGKGLLYLTKTENEKGYPHDILNMVSQERRNSDRWMTDVMPRPTQLILRSSTPTNSLSKSTDRSTPSRQTMTLSVTAGTIPSRRPFRKPRTPRKA